ncbi:MAG: cache domain-containing protein, partial [Sulfuricella sp.]|nr:cache domain-containing protein [Sulfuricella sp.]
MQDSQSGQMGEAMSTLAHLTKAISLRWRILIPLMVGFTLLITVFAIALFTVERVHFEDGLEHELDLVAAYHRDSIRLRGQKLAAVAEALARDPGLRRVLAAGDRQDLLRHADPIFKGMKQDFSITHFYFHDAELRTLLRVHNP